MSKPKPVVINCILIPRKDAVGPMFTLMEEEIIPNLDGYAIIPKERYEELLNLEKV